MKIKPLYDNIVVELKEQTETTKSGFFLPSSSEKYVTAKVLAAGCGVDKRGNQSKSKRRRSVDYNSIGRPCRGRIIL